MFYLAKLKRMQLDRYKPLHLTNSLDVILGENRHIFLVSPLNTKQLGITLNQVLSRKTQFYPLNSGDIYIYVYLITEVF